MSTLQITSTGLQLLRAADLCKILGISNTTLWRWRKAEIIPEPISLGPRVIGWRLNDINSWLEQQLTN